MQEPDLIEQNDTVFDEPTEHDSIYSSKTSTRSFQLTRTLSPQKKPSPWPARMAPNLASVEADTTYSLFTLLEYLQVRDPGETRLSGNNFGTVSTLSWNLTDGLFQIYEGINTWRRDDHHGMQNKFVGILNILGGTQELLLSPTASFHWLCRQLSGRAEHIPTGVTWAGWAFAAGMWADWIGSSVDLYGALKTRDFKGWLVDKIDEAIFLQNKINTGSVQIGEEVYKKLVSVLKEIQLRCRVNFHMNKPDGSADLELQKEIKTQLKRLIKVIPELKSTDIKADYINSPSETDKKLDGEIQQKSNQDCLYKFVNWTAKSAATAGMTIYTVDPRMINLDGKIGLWLTYITAIYAAMKLLAAAGIFAKEYYESKVSKPDQTDETAVISEVNIESAIFTEGSGIRDELNKDSNEEEDPNSFCEIHDDLSRNEGFGL